MSRRPRSSLWLPAVVGGFAVAWYRDRGGKQSAERLAAATLETLMNAIDANDEVTGKHVRRTASYARCLGAALGLAGPDLRKLERVALFHDVGKIHAALFDIVHDESRLTDEERAQIATHAQRGADVLRPLAAFYPELPAAVLAHHERWDGAGYPHGIRGEAIPLYARVVAIADTFDAITHTRRYHPGENFERGVALIGEGRGTQFDPHLVDVFLSDVVQSSIRRTYEASRDESREPRGGPKGDRRADSPESTVPDVSFRWRTRTTGGADDEPRPTSGGSPAPAR